MQGEGFKKTKWRDWLMAAGLTVLAVRTGQNVWRLFRTGDRVNEARAALEEAKVVNGRLQARLNEVNSPEFIEREAREKLGLGREGEVILLLPEQNANPNDQIPNPNEARPNWRKWWDLYVGL